MWHDQDVAGRDAIWQKRWGVAPSRHDRARHADPADRELLSSRKPRAARQRHPLSLSRSAMRPARATIFTHARDRQRSRRLRADRPCVARSTFYGLVDRDFRDATTNQATIRVEHDFGGITLRNTARYTHSDQAYIFLLPDDSHGQRLWHGRPDPATCGRLCLAARQHALRLYRKHRQPDRSVAASSRPAASSTASRSAPNFVGEDAGAAPSSRRADRRSARAATPRRSRAIIAPACSTPTRTIRGSIMPATRRACATPIVKGAANTETQNDAQTQALYALRFDHADARADPQSRRALRSLQIDRHAAVRRRRHGQPAHAHRRSVQLAGRARLQADARHQPLCQLRHRGDAAEQPARRRARG